MGLVLSSSCNLLLCGLSISDKSLIHEQSWPVKSVAHLVFFSLSVKDVPDLITNNRIWFEHILPNCEREICSVNCIWNSIFNYISQGVAEVGLELLSNNVNARFFAVVVELHLKSWFLTSHLLNLVDTNHLLLSVTLENTVFLQDEIALPVLTLVNSDRNVLEFVCTELCDECIFTYF